VLNQSSTKIPTEKLRELILYIAEQSEGDRSFGSIKLNKLLFFADFKAYLMFGQSITGQEYQKLPQGPAPRQILSVMNQMQEQSELAIALRQHFGYTQKKPIALREPDLSAFSGKEIALVDETIQCFAHLSANRISEVSHDFIGWQTVNENETIPYASALIDNRQLSPQEIQWASEIDTTGIEEFVSA